MSFLRRLKPQPKIFFQENLTAIEYDYKEVDAKFDEARRLFFNADYRNAYKGFREVVKRLSSDNINHKLASFYIGRLEKLGIKLEESRQKTILPELIRINI